MKRLDSILPVIPIGLVLAILVPAPAAAQLGPRILGNTLTRGLDAGGIGDQLSITSSDSAKQKMDLIRDLSYREPEAWQSQSVTWLRFDQTADGEIVITEGGRGVVRDVVGFGKWSVEPLEDRAWKAVASKGGRVDLYLNTKFRGEDYRVGAVVPKFEGTAYGAVYRGMDFLFFVVQKKAPVTVGEG